MSPPNTPFSPFDHSTAEKSARDDPSSFSIPAADGCRHRQQESNERYPEAGGTTLCTLIADIAIIPLGAGNSLSPYVAACERVLRDAGLKTQLHANGTNVEGEWDEVMAALKRCHEVLHEMGAPRVATNMRLGTRTDKTQTMDDKIRSVEQKLDAKL